jgi:hypothetical protein
VPGRCGSIKLFLTHGVAVAFFAAGFFPVLHDLLFIMDEFKWGVTEDER